MTADSVFNFFRNNRGLPVRSMTIFNYLLEAALAAAIMVLLVLVVRRFFRKQAGSKTICFAWLLIALRLFVPLALPNPLMDSLRPTYSMDAEARPVADQFRVRFQDAWNDFAWNLAYEDRTAWREAGIPVEERPYTAAEFLSDIGAYTTYGWTGKWFLLGYLTVALGVGGYFLARSLISLQQMKKRRYLPLSPDDELLYTTLCQQLKVNPLPAYYVGSITGVQVAGLWRPYIAIASTLKPEDTRNAMLRALVSYKQGGHWWSALRRLCCAVQWFNPFVWLGAWLSRRDFILAVEEQLTEPDEPKYLWVRRSFAAACCVVLLCSFFTAETTSVAARNAMMSAAINAGPALPRGIVSKEEAIALAESYIHAPLLRDSRFHGTGLAPDYCAYKDSYGWHVSMMHAGVNRFLLLDDAGQLLAYDTGINIAQAEPVSALPAGSDDALEQIATQYVQQCLLSDAASDIQQTPASGMIGGQLYSQITFTTGGESCTMTVNLDEGVVAGFVKGAGHGPNLTQKDVLPIIRQYLMKELGVDDDQARMTLQQVMVENREGKQVLLGIISEQPTWMSPEAAARLLEQYGKQDRYAFQLVIDPAGGEIAAVEFLPQESYPSVTGVLDTQTAGDTFITYEIIKERYLVQASSLPAGTSFDILTVANVYAQQLIPTGGAMNIADDLALVRFTHPASGKELTQWVRASQIEDNRYLQELGAEEITCTVGGATITLQGYDYQHGENPDGFYGNAPENAAPLEQVVAIVLEAIQAEYGIAPEDFQPLPIHFGFYHNSESATDPIIHWRVDLPDPRSSNMDFECYVAPDGTLQDVFGPEDGNG